jgi:hypothetical protein
MAKVNGPLMSMSASGGFAGALVFGTWKGRNVVHHLVTPGNPQTADQESARNRLRVIGAIQHHILLDVTHGNGLSVTDLVALKAATPAGFAWNGNLAKLTIGTNNLTYDAIESAWTAIGSTPQGNWDSAAAALTPAYAAVAQKGVGGIPATAKSAGFVLFAHQYALYMAGLRAVPASTPPTYA